MTESTGNQLKQAREGKGVSIEHVAEELHIRESYLHALENDNLAQIPSEIQAKGFLRLYAEFLDITLMPADQSAEKSTTPSDSQTIQTDTVTEAEAVVGQPSVQFGQQFIEKRQELGKEHSEVQQELHINPEYLQAIEQENFSQLPPASQAKGMIERYAEYLGLDPEEILGVYAELLILKQTESASMTKQKKRAARKVDGVRQIITPDLIIGFILIAIILFIGFLSIRQIMQTRSDISSVATLDAVSPESSLMEETPQTLETEEGDENEGLTIRVATATLPVILPQEGEQAPQSSRIIVQLVANQRAYLRVTADDEIAFEGRVIPGNVYEFFGDREITIVTGNASAFDITLIQDNQTTQLGRMGLVGEILDITFQPDTIITPTPMPTQTPTITNTPQVTVTPTATSEPVE